MTRAIGVALTLGAVGTVGLLAWATDLSRPSGWLWGAAITLWSLTPYGVAARATRLVERSERALRVMLATAVLLSGFGLAGLASAFIFRPDAQSGVVPLFLPIGQLLGMAPLAIAAQWLARRELEGGDDRDPERGS
jgi:hypothetical protein